MVQQKQKSVVIQSITQILQYLKSEEVNGLITTSQIATVPNVYRNLQMLKNIFITAQIGLTHNWLFNQLSQKAVNERLPQLFHISLTSCDFSICLQNAKICCWYAWDLQKKLSSVSIQSPICFITATDIQYYHHLFNLKNCLSLNLSPYFYVLPKHKQLHIYQILKEQ